MPELELEIGVGLGGLQADQERKYHHFLQAAPSAALGQR